MTLTEIWVYPVKSLGGIKLTDGIVEKRGLQYDRRWVIVDENYRFVTQREYAQMALLAVEITQKSLIITDKRTNNQLNVPLSPQTEDYQSVTIWDDTVAAVAVSNDCDEWLSKALGFAVRLMYMPDTSPRPTDRKYSPFDSDVSFADGFPFLVISQASLNDLNARLESPIEMLRFRPNFVVEGALPYSEDDWYEFTIGSQSFWGVKPCARCILTTVNPQTGTREGNEPLYTLSTYRKRNNKIYFGQNVITNQLGHIKVGDAVVVKSTVQRGFTT
jgi:uncharacterized protein